mgnify:FL=1
MIARAAHDAALAEVTRRAPMPGPDADEATVDAWLDESERAHGELRVDALGAALAAAEEAMLAWSFEVARSTAAGNQAALRAIAEIEAGIQRASHMSTRTKAIDLALRLAA